MLSFDTRICPQGIIVYRPEDIEIMSDEWDQDIRKTYDWLDRYILTYKDFTTGPLLDEMVMNDLGLSSDILTNGRLDGLYLIDLLLKTHYKTDEYYITADRPTVICFAASMTGFNRLFVDTPVRWEDLNNVPYA